MGQTIGYKTPKRAAAEIVLSFDVIRFKNDIVRSDIDKAIMRSSFDKDNYLIEETKKALTRRIITVSSIYPAPKHNSLTYKEWRNSVKNLAEVLAKEPKLLKCEVVLINRDDDSRTTIPIAGK